MKWLASANTFWRLSIFVFMFAAGDFLIYGPSHFSWFRVALLALIATVAVKLYVDIQRKKSN